MSRSGSETFAAHARRRLLAGIACLCASALLATAATTEPSFQVDYPFPTADKPQSKLWFAGGAWWALLPRAAGPSLWERTGDGWREHAGVAEALRGWPGRADVWFDADGATAVGVADRQLGVMRLSRSGTGWQPEGLARLYAPDSDAIETATIVRDGRGHWWIAAVVQSKVYVWDSPDARAWSRPSLLARGLHVDDLCLIAPIPGGVVVIWSNQRSDAILMRARRDTNPFEEWDAVDVIDEGGRTADDHLNAALTSDGALWVASKNSVDAVGAPQLVLRIRSADGRWRNRPYAPVTDGFAPSRPIVVATPDPGLVVLGHVMYASDDRRLDHVVFGLADPDAADPMPLAVPVIAPDIRLATRVNDVTGPKAAFPADAPWIVLASDGDGRVFEADLRVVAERARGNP